VKADRIAEIRARVEAATPGPWLHHDAVPFSQYGQHRVCGFDRKPSHVHGDYFATGPGVEDAEQAERDERFIAAARQDVPALLAEVDRLEAERDAAQLALAEAQTYGDQLRQAMARLLAEVRTEPQMGGELRNPSIRDRKAFCEAIKGASTLLAAPADNAALREFGLRVARAVHENDGDGTLGGTLAEVVDAVLRGGAP
jgi:hypothetical protein